MRKGFSLAEAVVAIAVLLVGVVSIISLGIAATGQARQTKAHGVATELAREGVEVFRGMRDGNWLISEDGGTPVSLTSGTDYTAVLEWNSTPNTWTLDYSADSLGNCGGGFDCTRIYEQDVSPYAYAQFNAPPVGWTETQYQRLLQLFPICRSTTYEDIETLLNADGLTCAAGDEQVGQRVISTVQWTENGVTKTSQVETQLYDWKY